MANDRPALTPRPAPAHPGREWLFKDGGRVFGPLAEERLLEMLHQGRIDPRTPVASDDATWRPLGEVPGFLVHVKRAEAQAKVEREITGARALERRRIMARGTVAVALGLVVLAVVGAAGGWLALRRPWERRSELLADFGGGVSLASVRVGGARRGAGDDEVLLPAEADVEPGGPGAGSGRRAVPAAAARPQGQGLLLAEYDPARIQSEVARQQATLAPCLREASRRSPDFAGEIPIEFAIGNDGRVARLWIDEPRFRHGELRDCLLGKLGRWSFASFPGERPVVQLAFRIGAR